MLTRVEIEGFRSFGSPGVQVNLSPLNFIVGPNASGKTNFIAALRFLQNAVRQDAEFAVNELGGAADVRNKLQRQRQQVKHLRLSIRTDDTETLSPLDDPHPVTVSNFDYTLEIDLRTPDDVPVIVGERLRAQIQTQEGDKAYELTRDTNEVRITDPVPLGKQPDATRVPDQERSRPALAVGFFSLPSVLFRSKIERWSFFNISPQIARQPYKAVPEATLGSYGENLAVVLHNLEARNGRKRLSALVASLRGIIPGFQDVKAVRDRPGGKWALQIAEEKIKTHLNADSVSDGTIRLLALMVIAQLGAGQGTLIAIEEPENSVHPHVSEHLVDVFRETSGMSQVIATTHNPACLDPFEPREVHFCG